MRLGSRGWGAEPGNETADIVNERTVYCIIVQLYSERQRNAELHQRLSEPPPPLHAYPPPQYANQTELQSLRQQVYTS